MTNKVLVAYSSKLGATAEIASRIRDVLKDSGLSVDLLPVKKVGDLGSYQAIVLGSAVYYGRWRKDAVKFLTTREEELSRMPVWFFSSGPTEEGDPVSLLDGWTFPQPQEDIAGRIQPRDKTVFHGVLDEKKLNFFERWILKKMETVPGDYRDWEMITSWAKGIALDLR